MANWTASDLPVNLGVPKEFARGMHALLNSEVLISFEFVPEKFADALAYLSSQRILKLTPLKAAKLFFLADQRHVRTSARPIFGDEYYFLDHGATPIAAYDAMQLIASRDLWQPSFTGMLKERRVRTSKSGAFYRRHQASIKNPWRHLSQSDVDALAWVVERYRHHSVTQLVELVPKGEGLMDYQQFFEGAEEDERSNLELMAMEQEDRTFMASMRVHRGMGDPFNIAVDPSLCLVIADLALERSLAAPHDIGLFKEWALIARDLTNRCPELPGLEKHREYAQKPEVKAALARIPKL